MCRRAAYDRSTQARRSGILNRMLGVSEMIRSRDEFSQGRRLGELRTQRLRGFGWGHQTLIRQRNLRTLEHIPIFSGSRLQPLERLLVVMKTHGDVPEDEPAET